MDEIAESTVLIRENRPDLRIWRADGGAEQLHSLRTIADVATADRIAGQERRGFAQIAICLVWIDEEDSQLVRAQPCRAAVDHRVHDPGARAADSDQIVFRHVAPISAR